MCKIEVEEAPPLLAGQYRRLLLDSENELGLVAEMLAEVLGWQRTPEQPLPDALELAEAAAERMVELEVMVGADLIASTRRPHATSLHFMLN